MESIVEQLRRQSASASPLVAKTIRMEGSLESQIEKFATENGILPSVVLRKAIELGFNVIKADHDNKSSR